jgi:CheY-like chemotaxis protein
MVARKKSPSILVVEDETVLRGLLMTTLQGEGYRVYEATNGKEGLDASLELHPQLILLDIIMPEMNGIDMLKRLRQDKWGRSATVVLLTNLGDRESIESAKEFEIRDYLVKSDWSLDEISQKIKELLS